MSLPEFSIRRPITVTMVCMAVGLMGFISLKRLPIELYPNFNPGHISIIIQIRGGMPPDEVENQVIRPIEDAVSDVTHLKDVIAIAEEGRARVVLTFEPGTDMDFASLEVREKFSRVRSKLPKEIEKPVIAKFDQEDVPILIVAVTALGYTPEMLRRLVDEEIKDRIMRVEGVANVDVGGGRERKFLVEIDIEKLQAFRLPIDRVTRLINVSNLNLLTGEVDRQRNKYIVRAMGEFQSIEEIENLGIATTPTRSIIRIKDVATVKDSFLEPTTYARVNALPVVSLYIQKETTSNTVQVAKDVLQAFDELKENPRLPKGLRFIVTYDQSVQIKRAIEAVWSGLISGGVLAILVLGIFYSRRTLLGLIFILLTIGVAGLSVFAYRFGAVSMGVVDWTMQSLLLILLGLAIILKPLRLTLAVALSIPIATIVTFGFVFFLNLASKGLHFQPLTLNIMTLGGLAVGVGMLVDNSIVVLNNVLWHKRRGKPMRRAAGEGASEMLLAIVASTLTTVVVFLPIVFINKEIRLLYIGFALTICFALLASICTALSVVPLIASRLVGDEPDPHGWKRFPRWIGVVYRRFLSSVLRGRWVAGLVVVFLGMAGFTIYQAIPKELLGTAEGEDFTIFVELPSGAKLEISDQVVTQVEKLLKDVPEVKSVSSRVEHWSSKVYVKLVSLAERSRSTKDIIDSLRPQVEEIAKQVREAFIYFEEPHEVETNEVIVEIYGWDYEILTHLAVEMLKKMQTIPGLTDLKMRWRRGRPEWFVRVDKIKAKQYGLSVQDIAETLHAEVRGLRASVYHAEGGKEVEIVTRLEEPDRATLDKLKRLTFTLPDRTIIRLDQVARLEPAIGPSKIWRKNKQRMIQVSANRGRYAFGEAAQRIYGAIKDVPMPKDYYWRFGENYWKLLRNQREMRFALVLSIVLSFLVLASLFESVLKPFIILATVPMGLFGGFLALRIAQQSLNMGALMGLILLGGVVVNNAIVLVDEINRLQAKGMRVKRATFYAAIDRLRPIWSTSLTTILGLLPLALSRTEESGLWSPMAIVIIGGLSIATLLTPVFVPSLYLISEDVIRFIANVIPFRKTIAATRTVS